MIFPLHADNGPFWRPAPQRIQLHLIGRRVNANEWAGVAAILGDSESVTHNSMQALALAETIISEVNSNIVVIDRHGSIQRFNRRAEEYTDCTEDAIIGQSANELFMLSEEASASHENIECFFDLGKTEDMARTISTVDGQESLSFAIDSLHFARRFDIHFAYTPSPQLDKARIDTPGCRPQGA